MKNIFSIARMALGAFLGFSLLFSATSALAQTGAGQSAVVLNYQRFGEEKHPQTNVRTDQFAAHVKLLSDGRYNVVSAESIVDTLFSDGILPNRSVAITIDDAYRSAYEVAWPLLRDAGLPFTLFISTDHIDQELPGFMSWDQIRELRDAGATIGLHTAGHVHMLANSDDDNRADLARALASFERELGQRPKLFSYPHGEMGAAAAALIKQAGMTAAFGQHSGVVNATLDRYFLPRFSINAKYGETEEFRRRIDALGLPIHDLTPADPHMKGGEAPVVAFSLDGTLGRAKRFACFYAQGDEDFVEIPVTDSGNGRMELRFEKPFRSGPWRLNCTLPTGGKRHRWFGMQFHSTPE